VRRRGGGEKVEVANRRRGNAGGLFVRVGCWCGRRRWGGGFRAAAAAKRVLKMPAPPPHPHAAAAAAAVAVLSSLRCRRPAPGFRRRGGAAAQRRRRSGGGKVATRPRGGAVYYRRLMVLSLAGRGRCCTRAVAALPSVPPPRWLATQRRGGARVCQACWVMVLSVRKLTNEDHLCFDGI